MDHSKPRKMDPLAITESLGFKTFRRSNRNTWLPEEDAQLVNLLSELYTSRTSPLTAINADEVDWDLVTARLSKDGARKAKEFKKRWCTSLDPNLRKGKWTKAEDDQLIDAYNQYGASWQKVAAAIKTRTMDQCAKRYTEVLDPKTKDRLIPWTRDEELLLIKQVRIHGTKWRTVASNFEGRPALTCRNRWRKIVINVVKGKADPVIQKEVESITHKGSGLLKVSPEPSPSGQSSPNYDDFDKQPKKPVEPVRSDTEWKYTLAGSDDAKLPHQQLFGANGGAIKDEQSVQALISYAKMHNLSITVHQHVHHHYSPPPPPFTAVQPPKPAGSGFYGSPQGYGPSGFESPPSQYKPAGPYYLEPESTLNRFQHFNYLPPLTEVPKLTSSNSPPSSVKAKDEERTDLSKMFSDNYGREASPMTPLTQAVQMAAAAEANYKRPHQWPGSDAKKPKHAASTVISLSDDEEEGMDFWEQMRNLSEMPNQQKPQKPVSQHHPLHHFTGSVTPQPQARPADHDRMDEDEEEMDDELRGYGIFYKPKDEFADYEVARASAAPTPAEAADDGKVYEGLVSNFGVFPFNPS